MDTIKEDSINSKKKKEDHDQQLAKEITSVVVAKLIYLTLLYILM